jgi:hypothetical protein
MDLTKILALIGTILSTVAVTWNIMRNAKDRARLKLDAMIGKISPLHTDRTYFTITMTNIGSRPIMVKNWGYYFKKTPTDKMSAIIMVNTGLPGIPGLPRMLKEGEFHTEFTEDLSMLESNVIKVNVSDSRGRKWCLSKKVLRRLRADLEKKKRGHDLGYALILKKAQDLGSP